VFALLGYTASDNVGGVTTDLAALVDPDFTQRNGHYTFTEQYRLGGVVGIGTNVTRTDLLCPTWNAIGLMNSYPPVRSATPVSSTYVDLRTDWQVPIPLNEEFQVQQANDAGAANRLNGVLWIFTQDWNRNLPAGIFPIMIRATSSVTKVANAWSGPATITLEQSLRGGVYSIIGYDCFLAGCIASRIIFPRQKLYQGRKLRPGNLCQNALGDFPPLYGYNQARVFGEWGRFHTFELPQIEVWGNAAGAVTAELRIHAVYLGTDLSLLESGSITI
jgi:hypothetical protein